MISDIWKDAGDCGGHILFCMPSIPLPAPGLKKSHGWILATRSGKRRSLSSGAAWVAEGEPEAAPAFFNIRRAIWPRKKLLEGTEPGDREEQF